MWQAIDKRSRVCENGGEMKCDDKDGAGRLKKGEEGREGES